MKRGSITIFSLISMLLITAAIFALLEGTRFQEMHRFAELQTKAALESAFASYNSYLWKNYRLLGTSQTRIYENVAKAASGRIGSGTNLLRFRPEEIDLQEHSLLTDADGLVFVKCVSAYMKENFTYELAKEIYSQYEAMSYLMETSEMDKANIDEALEEIEDISSGSSSRPREGDRQKVLDILLAAKRWQEIGVLELVLENTDGLSESEQDFSNGLLERKLATGSSYMDLEVDWLDKILLQQYLRTYLSGYRNEKENRALSYEMEYLVGEKSSDIGNLYSVVVKVLGLREAANFAYLISKSDMVAQAELMAVSIAGVSANPILIQTVKVGLLTAWAFAESILDVRALLAGKRIAAIKSEESWTVGIEGLIDVTQNHAIAKESKWGQSYEDYLGMLLLFEDEQTLAMRAMNLQEASIRKSYQDPSFGMDTLITGTNATIRYSYKPVFPFLSVINAEKRWEYSVWGTATYGYY